QVDQLIAFLRYTSEMNTEGWPPKPRVDGLASALASPFPDAVASVPAAAPAGDASAAATDPAALGAQLAKDYACTSCHALDDSRLVGPGWGGLHGSQVSLVDGSTVTADDAFLANRSSSPTPGSWPATSPAPCRPTPASSTKPRSAPSSPTSAPCRRTGHDPDPVPDPAPEHAFLHADDG